ncbi:hypothetical protein H257_00968 [Aphanomyces astaci]|uniref:Uncharacterized protein n=1 Tax=Aphanomyces astaci TaxID=112090 RepID=W4H7T9_APHAT|nr:hypothetical protein H257_00968 [Aphanomyces astaci]ETV87369.1 hypothetical protein H257_00968 [Aphanomyces astaci]|eukprot:XP_009822232.1 hypothetical protein H257_00968 [Aphanomyces astaci]
MSSFSTSITPAHQLLLDRMYLMFGEQDTAAFDGGLPPENQARLVEFIGRLIHQAVTDAVTSLTAVYAALECPMPTMIAHCDSPFAIAVPSPPSSQTIAVDTLVCEACNLDELRRTSSEILVLPEMSFNAFAASLCAQEIRDIAMISIDEELDLLSTSTADNSGSITTSEIQDVGFPPYEPVFRSPPRV